MGDVIHAHVTAYFGYLGITASTHGQGNQSGIQAKLVVKHPGNKGLTQSRIIKPHALSWINKVAEVTSNFPKSIQRCFTTPKKKILFI